ncbi:MAG TPA: response regulator [Firmicutes bacterium]|jgi:two-component system chemotaxis response regulator CheY|nr:response regulator [Bacillota bacterium]
MGTISPISDTRQPKGHGVLIVDDQRIMRLVLASMLTDAGIPILGQAANGLEALELYVQLKPKVVLLDLIMPVMDGFSTMEKLFTYDPKVNIVICSSMQHKFYVSRALKAGASDFLVKPFRKEQVQTVVNKLLLGQTIIHQYPRYLIFE